MYLGSCCRRDDVLEVAFAPCWQANPEPPNELKSIFPVLSTSCCRPAVVQIPFSALISGFMR